MGIFGAVTLGVSPAFWAPSRAFAGPVGMVSSVLSRPGLGPVRVVSSDS